MVECRTPEREVRGSRPTAAVLCPWARHFTPRKYWLITQEAMAPSRHDWKIVDWDVKPQHNQIYISYEMASHVRSSIFIASHMWTPKTHARLCIRTMVSQSPSMLAHIKYRTRRRFWTDIKLDGWACSFEDSRDGGQKVPKPRVTAHTCMSQTEDSAYTTIVLIHASVGSYWTIFQQ